MSALCRRQICCGMLRKPERQGEEWAGWSDREIARRCGVNHHLVADVRATLTGSSPSEPAPRTFTTKHGTRPDACLVVSVDIA
jgi:hypothetical protein